MISAQDISASVSRLPVLSPSVVKLQQLLRDPDAEIQQFSRAISADPSLTAQLLKLANSAYFGCSRQIDTVQRAVTLLGTLRVYETVVGAAFSRVLPEKLQGYGLDSGEYWEHCCAVGVLASSLATSAFERPPAVVFTAGLLHDIGKLAVSSFLAQEEDDIWYALAYRDMAFVHAEHEVLGTDHAIVGAAVAERWRLPEELSAIIRWHHSPLDVEDSQLRRLNHVVHVADGVAHMMGYGADLGGLHRQILPDVMTELGLGVRQLERAAGDCVEQIDELKDAFLSTGGR